MYNLVLKQNKKYINTLIWRHLDFNKYWYELGAQAKLYEIEILLRSLIIKSFVYRLYLRKRKYF